VSAALGTCLESAGVRFVLLLVLVLVLDLTRDFEDEDEDEKEERQQPAFHMPLLRLA
jgi:hypothetical protein